MPVSPRPERVVPAVRWSRLGLQCLDSVHRYGIRRYRHENPDRGADESSDEWMLEPRTISGFLVRVPLDLCCVQVNPQRLYCGRARD